LAAVSALIFIGGRSEAKTASFFVKPGGSYEAWSADPAKCQGIAASARLSDLPPGGSVYVGSGVPGSAATLAGSLIVLAVATGVEITRARAGAEEICMRNLGYVALPLTPDEDRAYRHIWVGAKEAWERKFLAQDLSARLGDVVARSVPRLPPYRDEPMTQGGLKIDVGSLVTVTGPVGSKGDVLTGKASRWRTAVLAEPFETTGGFVQLAGAPGAVFYQVDYRPQLEPLLRPDGATWCGPVTQTASQGKSSAEVYCFTSRDYDYEINQATGYSWYSGAPGSGFTLPPFAKPIILKERAEDDLSAFDFGVRAAAIKNDHVDLEAYVRRNGDEVVIWNRRLKFDSSGVAVLPLWADRLVLTRGEATTLSVALDQKGDGHGWREGD
jgi:hypothetical protein